MCNYMLVYVHIRGFMNLKFYTVEEVAEKLCVHPCTIRKAIREKRIHAFRPGIGKKSPYRIQEDEFKRIMLTKFEDIKKAMGV